ncbi:MAG: 5-formyltetrahydrofolate cyclo-ligase [Cyclobacteriaceae bacterium]|nr:5-formyltetrahydrofolate cyclo-ligase [Cyclobacteriaceae bacterium]
MNKAELRKFYLQKRQALSEAEYTQLNFQVYQQFFASIDLSFINVIHTFLPVTAKREPDTWLIIDRVRREFPHIRISIPRTDNRNHTLENFYFEGLHQLTTTAWGIQEPRQGTPTEPEKIDLVLVPLLAFDQTGHRLGYGKGFYDRFLKLCRPDCLKTGLSFFQAEKKIEGINELDVRMDLCVTPEGIIKFSN